MPAQRLRRPDAAPAPRGRAAPCSEQSLEPLRDASPSFSWKSRPRSSGRRAVPRAAQPPRRSILEALAKNIADSGVRLYGLQAEIDRINREINALGAVNLAALTSSPPRASARPSSTRRTADLTDRSRPWKTPSTRSTSRRAILLGSTFEPVNEHFGRMFPSLFGGGRPAGDDRRRDPRRRRAGDGQPPGKKNSTIHLLSGGEKALTAIALVFAIFQLNPAPFCLLDEVDAPLDDANTERYAKLVKEMAAGTSSSSSATTRSRWRWPSS